MTGPESRVRSVPQTAGALVQQAVRDALRDVDVPQRLVVGFSGGVDSTVLLDALAQCRPPQDILAWHVHHGLQTAADQWSGHCERVAQSLGVSFGITHLAARPAGTNLEAWARAARYEALWAAAARFGATALLVAHHADDQVETVLMRLARGSGPAALAGMPAARRHADGWLLRPLLALGREQIVACARERGLQWVEDPMNEDADLLRSALRTRIVPELARRVPALRENVLRSAHWLRECGEALDALAQADLRAAGFTPGARWIDRRALMPLPPGRRRQAARVWLASIGAPVPGHAALLQWDMMMFTGRSAHARFVHGGWQFQRYRDRIEAVDPGRVQAATPVEFSFRWQGEAVIAVPQWGGCLTFEETALADAPGAVWLAAQPLSVRAVRGTSRLRTRPQGRARTLKNLFQEHGVAPHLRPHQPALHAGDELLFVAGFGMDYTPGRGAEGEVRIAIGWRFDTQPLPSAPASAPLSSLV